MNILHKISRNFVEQVSINSSTKKFYHVIHGSHIYVILKLNHSPQILINSSLRNLTIKSSFMNIINILIEKDI